MPCLPAPSPGGGPIGRRQADVVERAIVERAQLDDAASHPRMIANTAGELAHARSWPTRVSTGIASVLIDDRSLPQPAWLRGRGADTRVRLAAQLHATGTLGKSLSWIGKWGGNRGRGRGLSALRGAEAHGPRLRSETTADRSGAWLCHALKDLAAEFGASILARPSRVGAPTSGCRAGRCRASSRSMPTGRHCSTSTVRAPGSPTATRTHSSMRSAQRHDLAREILLRRAAAFAGSSEGAGTGPTVGGDRYLCGAYDGYSHAWSPYYAGRVIAARWRSPRRSREGGLWRNTPRRFPPRGFASSER